MTENEEFEFRLRLEREQAVRGSAPNTAEGVNAAFGKPAKEQPSLTSRLGSAALKGSLPFGPIGAVLGAAKEGVDIGNEALTKGAYEVGGAVTDITGSPKAGLFANALTQAVPSMVSVPARTPSLLEKSALRVMQSAVKPNLAARQSGDATKGMKTMLERDINATEGGKEFMQSKVTELENEVQSILANSRGIVNPENVAVKSLQESFAKVKHNLSVGEDAAVISESIGKLLEHPLVVGKGDIPVALANKIKQAIYKGLGDSAYGLQAKSTAEKIAEKAMARSLKGEIATAEPAVVPTLKEQAELLNALKVLSPRVGVEGNKNIFGLGALSPSVEHLVVWLADRSPAFKSMLARTIYTTGKQAPAEASAALQATQGQQ